MSTAYRDPAPPAESEEEPLPAFRPKVTVAGVAVTIVPKLIALGVAVAVSKNREEATMCLFFIGLPYVVATIIFFLERPVRDLLARRYARRVERGILELERKVASS
jgi:hypothetical protein